MKKHKTSNNHLVSDKEDKAWVIEFLSSKNPDCLSRLYEKHKLQLFYHCLRILNNKDEAGDCTSDAFMKAFANLGKFDSSLSFHTWLTRIATNQCIDQIRKRNRHRMEPLDSIQLSDEPDSLERKELQEKILKCIHSLKQIQRRCFCLFYLHDLSYKEIAELTGFSSNKVRSYIQNGRRNFKILMENS